jgi:adenylosuccinate synthase
MKTAFLLTAALFDTTDFVKAINALNEKHDVNLLIHSNKVYEDYIFAGDLPQMRHLIATAVEPFALSQKNMPDNVMVLNSAPILTPFHYSISALKNLAGEKTTPLDELKKDIKNHPNLVITVGRARSNSLKSLLVNIQLQKKQEVRALRNKGKIKSTNPAVAKEFKVIYSKAQVLDRCFKLYSDFFNAFYIVDNVTPYLEDNVIILNPEGVLRDSDQTLVNNTNSSGFSSGINFLKSVNYIGTIKKVCALGSFITRFGNGPLPSEDESLKEIAGPNGRHGYLDAVLLKYVQEVLGETDIVLLTDKLLHNKEDWPVCFGYINSQYRSIFYIPKTLPTHDQNSLFASSKGETTKVNKTNIIGLLKSIFKSEVYA